MLSKHFVDKALLHFGLPELSARRKQHKKKQADSVIIQQLEDAILLLGGTTDVHELAMAYPVVGKWMSWTQRAPVSEDGVYWHVGDAPPMLAGELAEFLLNSLNADTAYLEIYDPLPFRAAQLSPRYQWLRQQVELYVKAEPCGISLLPSAGERQELTAQFRRTHLRFLEQLMYTSPSGPGFPEFQRLARDSAVPLWAAERGWLAVNYPALLPLGLD